MGLREGWNKLKPAFERGRLSLLYPLWDAVDTILFTTGRKTLRAPHVRDAIDLKRLMMVVVLALTPCVFMALWNTGYQANLALAKLGVAQPEGWRGATLAWLGVGFDPGSFFANLLHGLLWFLPLYIVTMAAGGFWEGMFAFVRRHEINEGFLVTGLLFPLTLPPGTPLWQAAIGISFGVVIGKELFGGTGRNFLNPALAARAFLYFAYPQNLSGDSVWTAVDTFTKATPLTAVPQGGLEAIDVSWMQAFIGVMPGSLGETSVVACLVGALVLVVTGIGSWRIMLSMLLGALGTAWLFNAIGSKTNAMFQLSPEWHLVLGGMAFGLVFM
ncbi:MAG: NADH:ubiquinone reductase (Na(+)-transporting) subunit B, partial [Planctomycetota bacterium]